MSAFPNPEFLADLVPVLRAVAVDLRRASPPESIVFRGEVVRKSTMVDVAANMLDEISRRALTQGDTNG